MWNQHWWWFDTVGQAYSKSWHCWHAFPAAAACFASCSSGQGCNRSIAAGTLNWQMEHVSAKHREPPSARSRSTARRTMSRYRPARKIATDFHRGISFRLFYDLIIVPHLLFVCQKDTFEERRAAIWIRSPRGTALHRKTGCRYRLVQSCCASTKSHLVAVRCLCVSLLVVLSLFLVWSGSRFANYQLARN